MQGLTMMVLPAEVPSRLQLLPLMELPPPREPLKPLPRSACLPSCWTGPPLLSLHQEQHTQSRNPPQALAQLQTAGCEVTALQCTAGQDTCRLPRLQGCHCNADVAGDNGWLQECSGTIPRLSIISCSVPLCC